jgi:23S rRNA (cytidine1920-2'-O)/16S rRNA (cytidine1409-2'-O)-methyltransferase
VALFKPQFEVGPANVGKGGIVSNAAAVAVAAEALERWLSSIGWLVRQWSESPITGADGNHERLFVARNH